MTPLTLPLDLNEYTVTFYDGAMSNRKYLSELYSN